METEKNLDENFLRMIGESYRTFINVGGSSRTTAKLKPLHGTIAKNIEDMLGEGYSVIAQGHGKGKEANIDGGFHAKNIDITIVNKHTQEVVAVIEVKYVMQNYKQNAINYFDNMVGETTNIRLSGIPCYQIVIVPDTLPYFKKDDVKGRIIKHWEKFNDHNSEKYIKLSHYDPKDVYGVPDSTLLYVVHVSPDVDEESVITKDEYLKFFRNNTPSMELSKNEYPGFNPDGSVIYNDYEKFINKIYHDVLTKKSDAV